jgi:hypothetical protein
MLSLLQRLLCMLSSECWHCYRTGRSMQDVKAAESRSQQAPGALVVDLVLI